MVNVPDCFLQFVSAFPLVSVIVYSEKVVSGNPGALEYANAQWQVYVFVHELMKKTPRHKIKINTKLRGFMKRIVIGSEGKTTFEYVKINPFF